MPRSIRTEGISGDFRVVGGRSVDRREIEGGEDGVSGEETFATPVDVLRHQPQFDASPECAFGEASQIADFR